MQSSRAPSDDGMVGRTSDVATSASTSTSTDVAARLHAGIGASHVATAMLNTGFVVTFANAAFEMLVRVGAGAAVGRDVRRFIAPEDPVHHELSHPIADLAMSRDVLLGVDCGSRWARLHVAVFAPAGGEQGFIVQMADITERRSMQSALERNEELSRVCLDALEQGVAFASPTLGVHRINPAMVRILGYTAEELFAQWASPSWSLLDESAQPIHQHDFTGIKAIELGRAIHDEILWMRHRDGHWLRTRCSATPFGWTDEVVVTIADVTASTPADAPRPDLPSLPRVAEASEGSPVRPVVDQAAREFDALLAAMPDSVTVVSDHGIVVADRRGTLMDPEPPSVALIGKSIEELMGRKAARHFCTCVATVRSGLPADAFDVVVTTARGPRVVEGRVSVFDDRHVLVLSRDVTAERNAAGELSNREREVAAINDAVPQVIARFALDGSVTRVNSRWTELSGQPIDQALGHGYLAAIHPDDIAILAGPALRTLQDGQIFESRIRVLRTNGTQRWAQIRSAPLLDSCGALDGSVATMVDITAQVDATHERDRLAAALDLSTGPILITDPTGRITYTNRSAAPMTDRRSHLDEVLTDAGRRRYRTDALPAVHTHDEWAGEIELALPDGQQRSSRLVMSVERDVDGNTVRINHAFTSDSDADGAADRHRQELIDQLPYPVMIQVHGRVIYANEAALELMGTPDVSSLAHRMERGGHVRPVDTKRLADRLTALDGGYRPERSSQWWIVRPDGTERLVEWHSAPTEIRGVPSLLFMASDLTEMNASREALAASESHQRSIVEAVAEGVVVVDTNGICIDANESAATLFRLASAELLIGAPIDALTLVDPDGGTIDHGHHPVWRALHDAVFTDGEICGVRFGHRLRWMKVSAHPTFSVMQHAPTGAVVTFSDITAELEARTAVERSEARFRSLAAHAPVGIFETDESGACVLVNQRWSELTGLSETQAAGDGWLSAVHPDDRDRIAARWDDYLDSDERFVAEFRYQQPDGRVVPVHVEAHRITAPDGTFTGHLGTATDLTLQTELRHRLEASERQFRALADDSPDTVLRLTLQPFTIDYLSPAIRTLTGHEPSEFVNGERRLVEFIHPDDQQRIADQLFGPTPATLVDLRMIHAAGHVTIVEMHNRFITDDRGRVTQLEATIRDVTDARNTHDRLADLAHRDPLTGLLNRHALYEAIGRRIASNTPTSAVFIDLDGFKAINDTHGHAAGDDVLRAIATLLTLHVRHDDVVSRLGGDEFVIVSTPDTASTIAERLLHTLETAVADHHGTALHVGASIGIADISNLDRRHRPLDPAKQAETLVRNADKAMYNAKRNGKHQISHHT